MKTRVLFRGMTSSVGLSAVNQERSDKSLGTVRFVGVQKLPWLHKCLCHLGHYMKNHFSLEANFA